MHSVMTPLFLSDLMRENEVGSETPEALDSSEGRRGPPANWSRMLATPLAPMADSISLDIIEGGWLN